ncbi:MAG: 2-keto-4-pentenoate hydratase [Alphaproteobacteria bacterium]|nr:MAG: 2-keto-4-pentenoate hydratase [Alphaproteobacteria bacterium]
MSGVISSTRAIADAFVAARQEARPLDGFPGEQPRDLATSYKIQDEAIALWRDEVAGWKIGRVQPPQVASLGADRLAGPIFRRNVWVAKGAAVDFPVFERGFAAVEAEYVFRIGKDAPADKLDWTIDEAAALIETMHVGVETAGSPLATINDLGATVVVADFGNNHGLILGPEVPNWRAKLAQGVSCETFIEDKSVGAGGASDAPDGPLDALLFLVRHLAQRGKPLRAGQLVSTGAVTGVHDIRIGQHSRVSFNGAGDILCTAVKAAASGRGFS